MKNIIRLLLLVVTFTAFNFTAMAQNNSQAHKQRITREQLAEVQAKHIAKDLAFDEATSKRFIKTYCDYQQEVWALGPRVKPQRGKQGNVQTEQTLKDRFAHSQKILDLRKKYYGIYSEFLTQAQIERVYQLERQMMQRLAKKASQGRKVNGTNRPHRTSR